jgi:hypothetical protein
MGLRNIDRAATVYFANWYLHLVYGTETDPTLISFSNETWISTSQNMLLSETIKLHEKL